MVTERPKVNGNNAAAIAVVQPESLVVSQSVRQGRLNVDVLCDGQTFIVVCTATELFSFSKFRRAAIERAGVMLEKPDGDWLAFVKAGCKAGGVA